MPVSQVLGKFTEKKGSNGGVLRVVHHVHVDHVHRCLRFCFAGCKTLQYLIINLLLNSQDDLKLATTFLKPLRTSLKISQYLWKRSRCSAYFDSPISLHDVKHSVLGVKGLIFGF